MQPQPHACTQVTILVGSERPKGDQRALVHADPSDTNNSRFNFFKLLRGGFSLNDEKTLYRIRELLYADYGAPLVLSMLRRCDDKGFLTILNVQRVGTSSCRRRASFCDSSNDRTGSTCYYSWTLLCCVGTPRTQSSWSVHRTHRGL